MALQTTTAWMLITESIYDFIDKRGWLNLSLEQREKLIHVLEGDLAAARTIKDTLPIGEQRTIILEIAAAEEGLKGLTAVFKPPNR